jgi:hypothetical protein
MKQKRKLIHAIRAWLRRRRHADWLALQRAAV